jgi:hypothetical protein
MPIILLTRYIDETKVKVTIYLYCLQFQFSSIKTKHVFQKYITWKDDDK